MKILVVRYGTIGDTIFAIPFLRNLKNAFPDAQIDLIGDSISGAVLKGCPYITKVYHEKEITKNVEKHFWDIRKYDRVYILKNSRFFSIYAFAAGIKQRYGFDISKVKFLTKKATYTEDKLELESYLDLLRIDNIPIDDARTELWVSEFTDKNIKKIMKQKNTQPVAGNVVLHMYSRISQKNWIDDYWVKVVKYLSNELNIRVYFTGAEKDVQDYDKFLNLLGNDLRVAPVNLAGKLSIPELIALVKNCDGVVSVDTGTIHIAAAFEKPSVLLHGPTSIKRWKPKNENCVIVSKNFSCSPCQYQAKAAKLCKNRVSKCMEAMDAEFVIEEIKKVLTPAQPKKKILRQII